MNYLNNQVLCKIMQINRWVHSDSLEEDILFYIRQELDGLNRSAGTQHVPQFQALTRITKNCMVIFNSGVVGAAARILSTILL